MTLNEYLNAYEASHQHPGNKITHIIGIPMIVVSLPLVFWHPVWAAILFVVGWIFQLAGHRIEGNSPKFLQGPVFLLIGPLWIVLAAGRLLGLGRNP